jgi:hypothetical protein
MCQAQFCVNEDCVCLPGSRQKHIDPLKDVTNFRPCDEGDCKRDDWGRIKPHKKRQGICGWVENEGAYHLSYDQNKWLDPESRGPSLATEHPQGRESRRQERESTQESHSSYGSQVSGLFAGMYHPSPSNVGVSSSRSGGDGQEMVRQGSQNSQSSRGSHGSGLFVSSGSSGSNSHRSLQIRPSPHGPSPLGNVGGSSPHSVGEGQEMVRQDSQHSHGSHNSRSSGLLGRVLGHHEQHAEHRDSGGEPTMTISPGQAQQQHISSGTGTRLSFPRASSGSPGPHTASHRQQQQQHSQQTTQRRHNFVPAEDQFIWEKKAQGISWDNIAENMPGNGPKLDQMVIQRRWQALSTRGYPKPLIDLPHLTEAQLRHLRKMCQDLSLFPKCAPCFLYKGYNRSCENEQPACSTCVKHDIWFCEGVDEDSLHRNIERAEKAWTEAGLFLEDLTQNQLRFLERVKAEPSFNKCDPCIKTGRKCDSPSSQPPCSFCKSPTCTYKCRPRTDSTLIKLQDKIEPKLEKLHGTRRPGEEHQQHPQPQPQERARTEEDLQFLSKIDKSTFPACDPCFRRNEQQAKECDKASTGNSPCSTCIHTKGRICVPITDDTLVKSKASKARAERLITPKLPAEPGKARFGCRQCKSSAGCDKTWPRCKNCVNAKRTCVYAENAVVVIDITPTVRRPQSQLKDHPSGRPGPTMQTRSMRQMHGSSSPREMTSMASGYPRQPYENDPAELSYLSPTGIRSPSPELRTPSAEQLASNQTRYDRMEHERQHPSPGMLPEGVAALQAFNEAHSPTQQQQNPTSPGHAATHPPSQLRQPEQHDRPAHQNPPAQPSTSTEKRARERSSSSSSHNQTKIPKDKDKQNKKQSEGQGKKKKKTGGPTK